MRKTTKQEKLMKLGRKRQSFGQVYAEKFVPAFVAVTVICLIASVVLRELLIVYFQEIQMSDFNILTNSITQNMTESLTSSGGEYDKGLTFNLYSASIAGEDGKSAQAFRLYKQDKELMKTEKSGFAVVLSDTADSSPKTLCYADASCFDEAYERLSKYRSKAGIGKGEWYILIADTIYADTEKGVFVPGKMHIDYYSYDRFGHPPTTETVESFDITPADISGLTEYKENRFIGGTVVGVPSDDSLFETLDNWDRKNKKNGQISKSTSTSVFWEDRNVQQSWFRGNIYTPDGTLYTVTAAYRYDFTDAYIRILLVLCAALMLLCAVVSLIRASRTHRVYKAHYAMDDYRRDMTNTLAHDLKTPLMAVSGCAEMLRDGTDAEKQKKYSDMILANVEYMNGIISNVLELSKIESGSILNREEFDIRAAADCAAEKYRGLAEQRNIALTVKGKGSVNADRQLMTQAIDNLISNAVKYTTGGGSAEICISDKSLTVTNSCSKTDISPDELWKPFVKGDAARSGQTGSGLGLYIVKNICDRHGFDSSIDISDGRFTTKIDF